MVDLVHIAGCNIFMFVNDDFLLQSGLAKELYKEIKDLPIIDFHNHLPPRDIYKNDPYTNIADMWLAHDHYKWRLMRNSGIDEEFITGDGDPKDKFFSYVASLERAYMNPLHHWSHMELKEYFNITDVLTTDNAEDIYQQANEFLESTTVGPRELLEQKQVEVLCTTDDLNDDLEFHKLIRDDKTFDIQVLPTFRPDSLFMFNDASFFDVITLLEKNTSITISGITTLATALSKRLDYFNVNGCKVADHGLSELHYVQVSKSDASKILKKRLMKYELSPLEVAKLTNYLLKFFIKEYAIRDMVCQIHIGALRNTNERMFKQVGKDSGYDSLSGSNYINDLNELLNEIHSHYPLPKMILFNLNPRDNEALASLCGNFSCQTPGKVQLGAAWWFNDHLRGITNQLATFSEYLNLSTFVGMLTDSRSFLSFVRHDYFRRILCNFVVDNVQKGLIPNDMEHLKQLVRDIAYYNSKSYFNL